MNATHVPFSDTLESADYILAETRASGGGTFNCLGELQEFEDGYVVATKLAPTWIIANDDQARTKIAQYIEKLPTRTRDGYLTRGHIGTWVHEGNIYLDTVERVASLAEAQALGIARGEIAIWDCANKAEITL
jgi:hypothetical protein